MQCEKQKTTNKYKGKEHHQSSSVKYIRMGVQFSQFKWVRPTALYPVQKHMHLSRIGFLNIFEVHVQKTQKLDFDRLECPGNRPCVCVCVCLLVKLEHLLTSYVCVCAVSRPAQTILPHIRATIIGKRREEDTWKISKTKEKQNKIKKKKFTSVTFLYLDVTIWDHMANVRRESALK